jgi:hypothetical protein
MPVWLWCVTIVAGIAGLIGLGWLMHRFCICLEEAGYLYYREQPKGSAGGGILGEFDKLVRPSIQHTIQAKDNIVEVHEIDGD